MSGMFGGGKNVSTSSPVISSLRLQTSSKGKAIPLVFGKNRIAPNMLDYQDFTAIPHTETQSNGGKGGGGGSYSNTTYTYTTCLLMSLCEGPISGVTRIWKDKNQHTSSNPCGELGLSLYLGDYTQSPFGYMQSRHPERALAYRGLAYVAAGAYDLGDSATIPNHSFEVDAGNGYSATIRDANPHAILTQLLTNTRYGAGLPASKLADWTHYSGYCIANNLFLSPVYSDSDSAHNLLLNVLKITNTGIYFSEGKLKLKPYGDAVATANGVNWNPDLVPIYDLVDDHFLELPRIIRSSNADAFNQVKLKFYNRANDYNEEVVEAKDQANIELFGLRPAPEFDAKEIADPNVARTVAQLLLQRSLYIRNVYEFRLGWRFALLEPMDIVTITDAALGLDRQPVRITEIEEDEYGELTLRAEEMPLGVCSAALYPYQGSLAYSHNYNIAPGDCLTPEVIELEGSPYQPDYELALGIATAGQSPNWGGCEVWVSFDGATYSKLGEITTAARYGKITAALNSTATGATVPVLLNTDNTLISSSDSNALRNSTLSIIGNEMVSYTVATLTAARNYTLTLKNRGAHETVPATHAANTRFVRLDDAVFWTGLDFDQVGSRVYIKLPSFNVYHGGLQSLDEVDPVEHIFTGSPPGRVLNFAARVGTNAILLSWDAVRNRGVAGYEIRTGASWDAGTFVGITTTDFSMSVSAQFAGARTYWIRAFNGGGVYSIFDASTSFTMTLPPAPPVRVDVLDNNVLFYWTAVAGTLPTATYIIKKGASFDAAESVGSKDGLFTSLFEASSGTYTYWVAAVDSAGNVGAASSVTASVTEPPDYVLNTTFDSTFNGTKTNAELITEGLLLPVAVGKTWQQHFAERGWTSIQDQVNAGYPLYAQPGLATAGYSEVIEYGAVLPRQRVSVQLDTQVLSGAYDLHCELSTSVDGVTWSAPTAATAAYLSNFRYLKVTLGFTVSPVGAALILLKRLTVRMDARQIADAGRVQCVATHATGTRVYITRDRTATGEPLFIDVRSVVFGTPSIESSTPVFDFEDIPFPTYFDVYLFDRFGVRINGEVHYTVTGV